MKKSLIISFAICSTLLLGSQAGAQTKGETKLYNKTVSTATLKAYDKFLSKYPSSVYSAEIAAKKDTLLNISPFDERQAYDIAAAFVHEGEQYVAAAERHDAEDRIIALCFGGQMAPFAHREMVLKLQDGQWTAEDDFVYAPDGLDEEEGTFTPLLQDGWSIVTIAGKRYMQYSLLYSSETSKRQLFAQYLYELRDRLTVENVFEGNDVRKEGSGEQYLIEGRLSPVQTVGGDPARNWIAQTLRNNDKLIFISDGDYLTDYFIEKWIEANPTMPTGSGHLNFGIIPIECSLVEIHLGSKKKNGSRYSASMFDYRGYTVVIAYDKEKDEYYLAWVEPECKNHYRDRLLNAIVFNSSSQLEMQYYHGNRYYKRYLNLTSKNIK